MGPVCISDMHMYVILHVILFVIMDSTHVQISLCKITIIIVLCMQFIYYYFEHIEEL